jgi:hypothetical protein
MSETGRLGDVVAEVLAGIEQKQAEYRRRTLAAVRDFLSSKRPNRKPSRQKQKVDRCRT